jgi:hypothetical protein
MKLKLFYLMGALLCSTSVLSANDDVGNWLMYYGSNKINDKYSIHTEFQFRNHTLVPNNTEQMLFRTGLNYHFAKDKFVTAGYAYIPSYKFGSEQDAPETEEHRIWQQFIANEKYGKVKLEHRFRLEQRWVDGDYKNRVRYRLMMFSPINNKTVMTEGSVFLGLYNEIFLNTKNTIFDRNRLYGAIGYQYKKNIGFQMGVMNQRVNGFDKWYLQFGLVWNTDILSAN